MRTLYLVPVLHNEVELLYEARAGFAKLPEEYRNNFLRFVDRYWDKIETELPKYEIQRMYLDGWTGGSWDRIAIHAQQGSRVSKAVLNLILKGAVLEQTEEEPLVALMGLRYKEFKSLEERKKKEKKKLKVRDLDELLLPVILSRDLHIRRNIRSTLQDGENGMLFLGMGHVLPDYGDIQIKEVYPKDQLKQELAQESWSKVFLEWNEVLERIYKFAFSRKEFRELEDYVDRPEKYGFNYNL